MQIGILERKIYTSLLKKKLGLSFKIRQLKDGDELKKNKFLDLDVLVSMTWGKTIWGGKQKISIPKAPRLKLLQLPGSGIDGIDFSLLPKGCKVCNVYEHEIPISEYVISNILNLEIGMINKINNFKSYDWKDSLLFSQKGHGELYGKKVGILGFGRIGKEIAKKLKAFTVDVLTITKNKKNRVKGNKNIHYTNINSILPELDFLIIACDLNKTTRNLISEKNIILLKKNAVLVNIARGPIINEKALFDSLTKKKIGGAIIDTWYKYPNQYNKNKFKPSEYNFAKFKNVIMTPHLSSLSKKMLDRRLEIITSNILALKNGKKLKNIVNY